jgi:hypothetical protein
VSQFQFQIQNNLVNLAQVALINNFGSKIGNQVLVVTPLGVPTQYATLEVDTDDPSVTADLISTIVTNATSQYISVSDTTGSTPSSPSPSPQGLDMGTFLNNWGDAIRKFFQGLVPTFPSLWWIFALIVGILLFVLFFAQFSKGLGEGIASR